MNSIKIKDFCLSTYTGKQTKAGHWLRTKICKAYL